MKRLLSALVLSAACLSLLGCPHRPPEYNGGERGGGTAPGDRPRIQARQDSSADKALAQAQQQAAGAPDKKKAAEVFLSVRKAYPETTAGQEALYQAGVIAFEAHDYQAARRAFNELLFENPLFDKAPDAKLKLGEAALEVGAFRDAYQTLSSLAERAEGDEKRRLLEGAARAAEGAFLFPEALKIAISFAEEARTPEEQKRAMDRVTDLVEGKVGFVDIARLAEELPPSSPAWPVLTFKLARIYYHLRDWDRLKETLQRFVEQAPSHPLASQAQQMLARIDTIGRGAKPKVIGVILPMTGRYQAFGEAVLRGIKLALEGTDLVPVVKDSQGDVNLAGKAVEDLAFEDGAVAIIGPLLNDDTRRAALVAEELQIPLLTLARAEGITDIGPHVFRNMLTNSAQAEALADYGVRVLGYKNWALIYPETPNAEDMTNLFWDDLIAHGATVRAAEGFTHDQTTFTAEAKKLVGRYYLEDRSDYRELQQEIARNTPDEFRRRKAMEKARSSLDPVVDFEAIFIPADWRQVSLVTPALAVEDIITNACDPRDLEKIRKTTGKKNLKTVTLFGPATWSSGKNRTTGTPELVERGGKFVMCSVYVDGFYADSARPGTKKFVKAFGAAYKENRDPFLLEAAGYDAAGMFRQVIEQARPRTRGEFREALSRVKDFDGAMGKTSFDERREGQKPLFFLTIDTRGVKELNPPAAAAAKPATGS